ncbi:FAD-dependent oxidoreductase [Microbacterium sp. A196]|uniref:FAD-dependent oxidoreductase n=1 Tax=unclassified Microbacterium TaxID=2609290 RepID=UPI003FD4483F
MAQEERSDEVLIVGCGIGGATAALALGRAGIPVRLLERAAVIAEVGAGLQVGPNAMRILRDLGVREHLAQKEVLPGRAVMRDVNTDEEVVAFEFDDEFRALYEEPYAVMHRGDLLSGLMKAAESTGNVTIIPGQTIDGIEDLGDRVRVTTAEGAVHEGRAVIGADGIRSRVRRHVIDDQVPLASQYVIYRGTIARTDDVENAVTLRTGPHHHVMHYPIRGGSEVNVVVSFRSDRAPVGSEGWGTEEELDEAFAAASPFVRGLLSKIDRSHKWVQFDRAPQAGWSKGRVVLTGDAAHPTHQYLAQGAGQAMEDAVALAAVLTEFPDDIPAAWNEFERRRFDRSSAVQRGSRFWGELSHVAGSEADQRDALLRTIAPDDRRFIDWIYTTSGDVPLPVIPPHRDVYEPLESERVLS